MVIVIIAILYSITIIDIYCMAIESKGNFIA